MSSKKKKGDLPNGLLLLQEWKKRLGLTDWTIQFMDHVKPEDMFVKDTWGCTSWEESTKEATVQMVDPSEMKPGIRKYDYESTLVHELLHLKLTLLSEGEDENDVRERILHSLIDDLARAFIDAKRSK